MITDVLELDDVLSKCELFVVELEMALAYWNIVLRDRFKFLDLWCQFLQVQVL